MPLPMKKQLLASRDLTREVPLQPTKKHRDVTSEINPLPVKRVKADAQSGAEDEKLEQVEEIVQTTLQQPKPKPPKHPYASFLKDFVDPVDSVDLDPRPDPRANTLYNFVSEWLDSVESDCGNPYSEPISRDLTRSAPEMGRTRDADGFLIPSMPASTGSVYQVGTKSNSGRKSPVETPLYRTKNLAENGIHMRSSREQLPSDIADLVNHIRNDRDSPRPSVKFADLEALSMGVGEPEVERYFLENMVPHCEPGGVLKSSIRQPMFKHTVPTTGFDARVSTPIPDMLYGYDNRAFGQQQAQLNSMGEDMLANNQGLVYPFFAIEFKGDGPGGTGSMWVATNQCLGASTSCVNIAETLNHHLMHCRNDKVRLMKSAVFSIAMNGTEARLYISWKHDEGQYYMQQINGFFLQEDEQYLKFRKCVRNILDWGKGTRLKEIRDSLDMLQ
ncbi:hypothetical protein K505DRAFT_341527 [Melanomma pulvis-pyrius CBS 109.77]|uniref:DUF7924 domain-containing protein n=1 Tax=Melanomma pulvis-pyrius CBS 109.77 TaxID=1314802 RepID=A0A6A6WY19_9PLEO|nr:hypothetical protein K505DRAFT_341527 [Melanomma pulvis-pyrius CBS 109.77]